jgi:putative flippase GtrA
VTDRPSDRLLWFGVLGGALAWATQFVANLAFTWAQCNAPPGRWQLPLHKWEIGISVVGIAIDLAAFAVSLRLFLATYRVDDVASHERLGDGTAPPLGRVNFLAMVALLVNFLTVTIMVMTAIAAPLLHVCQQS